VAIRWVDLAGLLLALGSLAIGGRVLIGAGDGALSLLTKVREVGLVAAWTCVLAGLATPFLRTRRGGIPAGAWWDQTWLTLTQTQWGRVWVLREIALIVAAVALLRWQGRDRGATRPGRVAFGALAVAVLLQSFGGHAATLASNSTLDALMATAHTLAAGVWAGGLALLAFCVVPQRRAPTGPGGSSTSQVLRAFSPLAATSTLVLLGTGLYQAGRHLPTLSSAKTTVYGVAVAVKFFLFFLAIAFAAMNAARVNPSVVRRLFGLTRGPLGRAVDPTGLAKTVRWETFVLGVALLGAALLTSVPTAREVTTAAHPSAPLSENVDGLFLTFESMPDGGARRRLVLKVRPTILPEPAPVRGADVILIGPGANEVSVALARVEDGRFEADTSEFAPGTWKATILLHREGQPDSLTQAAWVVDPPQSEDASRLRSMTGLLAAALLSGAVLIQIIPRRRSTAASAPGIARTSLERSAR
jgi:putative copper export protein